ncbi:MULTISPECIES: site-specific integrase [unclassified Brevundimonas]|uniref:site-specific integrase n=1 Tax=unclassified Brevundimonas TaxID=2622653 RepID=UPI0025B91904|nr:MULTISPECIES: site-specific integrase [unclassified Brevundimonas]
MDQYDLFHHEEPTAPLPSLPTLPSLIRYRDQFRRCDATLHQPGAGEWRLHNNGGVASLSLSFGDPWVDHFLRAHLGEKLLGSVTTVVNFAHVYQALHHKNLLITIITAIGQSSAIEFQKRWIDEFRDTLSRHQAIAVRSAAQFACRWEIGLWRESDTQIVRALPGHALDKYAGVRNGTSFLSASAQSRVVEFLDVTAGRSMEAGRKELQIAAVLALAFQFGLRRQQLASLEPADFTFHDADVLHMQVELLKQRHSKVRRIVTRKIQLGWVPIFRRWLEVRPAHQKYFALRPDELSGLVRDALEDITGTAYPNGALRHTSAQRLADAGISNESLSDFLGHTDTTAAQVYFSASTRQVAQINMALGYSPTYQGVAAAARGDMITAAQLLQEPGDRQIAGMPHGIPVTGIGACQSGQSSCQRNPVLACYTCHKFLPVSDPGVHTALLDNLRQVVSDFDQPEQLVRVSPAMMQLRTTLEAIAEVAEAATGKTNDI